MLAHNPVKMAYAYSAADAIQQAQCVPEVEEETRNVVTRKPIERGVWWISYR